ncbi:biopolymer transporter ExbD [Rhodobacterales bacterium HKCCSP123]|nr:biopolymer transporter ExbD [Rhodobacterales bacterium HKCCSP123]
MIDVVFLLLVFFMLAARFGQEGALDLSLAGGGAGTWAGPPRLVQLGEDGLRLNGVARDEQGLIQALTGLVGSETDLILIQPDEGAALQRLLDTMALLQGAGFTNLALVEP